MTNNTNKIYTTAELVMAIAEATKHNHHVIGLFHDGEHSLHRIGEALIELAKDGEVSDKSIKGFEENIDNITSIRAEITGALLTMGVSPDRNHSRNTERKVARNFARLYGVHLNNKDDDDDDDED